MIKQDSKKVYVGMSGGVDSSVSAFLLKEAGYDVTGVFIKVWQPEGIECTWKEDRLDAMRVAAELDIPFITLDLENEYKQGVIDYMIDEYRNGRTPNPDVMCNKHVKFGAFFDWAVQAGADFVATGHYTQNIFNKTTNKYELVASKDEAKDQGYFLWTLTQNELAKSLFPVGGMTKQEVRVLAQKANLYTKDKKDSQGLCFIGKLDIKEFLKDFLDEKIGDVIEKESGEIIGRHNGVIFFTLGERHGFVIDKKTNHDKPYYVVAKDIEKNQLVVSSDEVQTLENQSIEIANPNWISQVPEENKTYKARFRHGGEMLDCVINNTIDGTSLTFKEGDFSMSSGQSVVVFDGNILLGGGTIK